MIEQAAFLTAIATEPGDDVRRLGYADWLQENDQHDRAEFIRGQCQVARWDCTFKQTPEQPGWNHNCGTDERGYWLCQPIRMRCDTLLDRHRTEWSRLPCPQPACIGGAVQTGESDFADCPTCGGTGDLFSGRTVTFSRGFPESVSCTLTEVGRVEAHQYTDRFRHVWVSSAWARAVVKAVPVVAFVPEDVSPISVEYGRGDDRWRLYRAGIPEVVWDNLCPGSLLTDVFVERRDKAEILDALAQTLGRMVRAEVYGKAVPT